MHSIIIQRLCHHECTTLLVQSCPLFLHKLTGFLFCDANISHDKNRGYHILRAEQINKEGAQVANAQDEPPLQREDLQCQGGCSNVIPAGLSFMISPFRPDWSEGLALSCDPLYYSTIKQ